MGGMATCVVCGDDFIKVRNTKTCSDGCREKRQQEIIEKLKGEDYWKKYQKGHSSSIYAKNRKRYAKSVMKPASTSPAKTRK